MYRIMYDFFSLSGWFLDIDQFFYASTAGFHFFLQELELLPAKELQENVYIRCPVVLEQVGVLGCTHIPMV